MPDPDRSVWADEAWLVGVNPDKKWQRSHFFVTASQKFCYCKIWVKEIKVESNEFINNKKWINKDFAWQKGYGVFSYSRSHIDRVIKYVLNQEEHHKKKTFRKEYRTSLKTLFLALFSHE